MRLRSSRKLDTMRGDELEPVNESTTNLSTSSVKIRRGRKRKQETKRNGVGKVEMVQIAESSLQMDDLSATDITQEEPVIDKNERTSKRTRVTADQQTLNDAELILTPPTTIGLHPLQIDHVMDNVLGFLFPGSTEDNYNLQDVYNCRLVCQVWNKAAVRMLKQHCRIGIGDVAASNADNGSTSRENPNEDHDIEEELTLSILPITLNLPVENMARFTSIMKTSPDIPFVMYSLKEGLFLEKHFKPFVRFLQVCGPSMEQLLIGMEPSTCTMSFLTPPLHFTKLKRLKFLMKHSRTDYTTSSDRRFKVTDRIYPVDGINGMYFLQSLCNGVSTLDRLDIHWLPTLIPWSSTFGLKDLYLPSCITKLTLDTMNTDGMLVRNLLLHEDMRLEILKWSVGLPLKTLSVKDIKRCLKFHSKSLKSLYFSIWISRMHHGGEKLVEFPPMPFVEQLSLMGDGNQIMPIAFQKTLPKLSSLTLYHQMLEFLEDSAPSKSVKVIRILGAPIRNDVRNALAKTFPELETLILFPQRDLHSTDYLTSMFDRMTKLRILLSHISRNDSEVEIKGGNTEETLPNGLYLRTYRRSTYIVRTEGNTAESNRAIAVALEHLDTISRNPPFTLDAAAFSYL